MISIKDTVGILWIPCPKCGFPQMITEWGEKSCQYERCDGHKFTVEYNFNVATLILKEIENRNKQNNQKQEVKRPAVPKLQKVNSGWIMVPQPDTTDKTQWYPKDKEMYGK